jgi:hypothetical protein
MKNLDKLTVYEAEVVVKDYLEHLYVQKQKHPYLTSTSPTEKQIGNEKNELIKQLRKQNTEMLEMLNLIVEEMKNEGYPELIGKAKQLIKESTEL